MEQLSIDPFITVDPFITENETSNVKHSLVSF